VAGAHTVALVRRPGEVGAGLGELPKEVVEEKADVVARAMLGVVQSGGAECPEEVAVKVVNNEVNGQLKVEGGGSFASGRVNSGRGLRRGNIAESDVGLIDTQEEIAEGDVGV
jgi:hypothetical protein